MAKEFDIYLQKHLVECDLLIYSIPYHDGISVTNRLILEAALNGYYLMRFAAVQMGSELTAHIVKMIAVCLNKLNLGIELGARVEFEKCAKLYLENTSAILDASAVQIIGHVLNEVENGLILAIDPLVTQVALSAGTGDFPLLADADVDETFKRSLLCLQADMISHPEITQINCTNYINAGTETVLEEALKNLCYMLTFDASAAVEIMTLVLDTDIRDSLGKWYSGTVLNSGITGTFAKKFIAAQSIVNIMQEAAMELTKVLYPEDDIMVVDAESFSISMKWDRKLCEIDGMALEDIDDMTLNDIDVAQLI